MYDYRLISERLNLMKKIMPFHLAIPVDCLIKARQFYGELLGCEEGRSSDIWIDYNFYGHQLVCHCTEKSQSSIKDNPVDGKNVPVPHFGVVLERQDWQDLRDKLVSHGIQFLIEP
jgi:extradiol dioxygenase family protein